MSTTPTLTTLTLRIEDRPGSLGRTARTLAKAGVNIDAFQADAGNVRFVVADGDKAASALRAAGITCQTNDCIEVRLPNRPGELANLGEALGKANVNVQASFGAAGDGRLFLLVDNPTAARPVLERFGAPVATTGTPTGTATRNR